LVGALLLAGCAAGTRFHDEGLRLLAEGNRDAALGPLREAVRQDPTNSRFKVDMLKEQASYARELVGRGDEARRTGKLDEATSLYTKAGQVDPGNDRASRGLVALQFDVKHARLLSDAERALNDGQLETARAAVKIVLTENASSPAGKAMLAAIADRQQKLDDTRAAQIAAQSILRKPVTLQFRDANLRMVFEALSRTTGLNVILDRDVRADLKTTIFVKDASIEDTVDLILLQSQLEKRTLNANTLFIYPATAAKQKEYQDLQVRTFQVSNADAKYLQTVLKTVLKIKEVSVDERSNTLVLRDTPDAIAVATKVIAAHDVPDAEVMLEVEVLEVSRDRLSDIGLQLPTSFGVSTPSTGNTLSSLKNLYRNPGLLGATGLSATLNLQLEDSDANLLASPRIRARNKEKARILIGDRVPTITNTVTPVSTGTPVITGSVQYQEVGLKLEFEPQVYSDQEVGIKINLEVSNIAKVFTDAQGGRSYQIGTRNAQTSLRLRDGETQILGGLISDQDQNTVDKLPGLGQAPVIGALFSNRSGSRSKSEIVLSITPRIIRGPAITENAIRDIFSGTESSIRERALRLDPVSEFRGQTTPAAPSGPAATPGGMPMRGAPQNPTPTPRRPPGAVPMPAQGTSSPEPAPPAPDASPEVEPPAAPQPSPTPTPAPTPAPAPPPTPALPTSAVSSGSVADLNWSGANAARVGETFQVSLAASAMPALQALPLTVRFDPSVLRFVEANLGALAHQAGAADPVVTADSLKGRVDVPLNFSKPSALAGNGSLVDFTFTVKANRIATQLIASQMSVKTTDGGDLMLPPRPRSHAVRLSQ
jgi:general secretion pathway protein D